MVSNSGRSLFGIAFALASTLSYSLNAVLFKLAPVSTILFRGSASILELSLILPAHIKSLGEPRKRQSWSSWMWLFVRATSGSVGMTMFLVSLKLIDLADAVAIFHSSPVWATIMSALLTRSSPKKFEVLFLFTNIAGVALISRPTFIFGEGSDEIDSETRAMGIGLALIGAIGEGMGVCAACKISNKFSWTTVSVSVNVMALVSLPVLLMFIEVGEMPCQMDRLLVVVAANLLMSGEAMFYLSSRLENANVISTIFCLDLVLAYVWEFMFFALAHIELLSIIGATIIFASAISMSVRRYLSSKELEEEEEMKKGKCLLSDC